MGIHKIVKDSLFALRDLVIPYVPFLKFKHYDFAFLIHPRGLSDVYIKYPIARHFSEKTLNLFLKFFWPVTVASIKNVVSQKTGKRICGILISIPLTSEQILGNRERALTHILRACKLAEKLGCKVIGLGAFTSSISEGGKLLLGKVRVSITNGNSLTVGHSIMSVKKVIQKRKLKRGNFTIAVVGATGSIGSAVSELLLKHGFTNLILIGRTPEHIQELKSHLLVSGASEKGNILFTTHLETIKKAEMIIMAVAKENLIKDTSLLKRGVTIYDISQPKGFDKNILRYRPDIILYDGGLARTPHINFPLEVGFPRGVNFSCLAETILLAAEKVKINSIGKAEVDKVEGILRLAQKYQFTPYHIKI